MRTMNSSAPALTLGLILMALVSQCYGQLQVGYYTGKCGTADVEQVIYDVVKPAFDADATLVAALLRMLFHDCFIRGCDASLLLDVPNSEKTAIPNGSVRGYEVIDAAKAAVENICPGVVSCADIIVIATRVTVHLAKGAYYAVETGRRDGYTSIASDANTGLPAPNVPVPTAVQMFKAKGISPEEFTLLLAGHTAGIAHCFLFQNRLYNFTGKGDSDPSINPEFLPVLKSTCPQNGPRTDFANLDQVTPLDVDNGYLQAINDGRGILQVDQDIASSPLTRKFVTRYAASNVAFNMAFGKALNSMSRIDVLTGTQGEIRKSCRSVNAYNY